MNAKQDRDPDREREREEDDRRFTTSLAGLAVALLLILIGLYVTDKLVTESQREDCLLQGRRDCGTRIDLAPLR